MSAVDAVVSPPADTVTTARSDAFRFRTDMYHQLDVASGQPLTWQTGTSPFTVSVIGHHPLPRIVVDCIVTFTKMDD